MRKQILPKKKKRIKKRKEEGTARLREFNFTWKFYFFFLKYPSSRILHQPISLSLSLSLFPFRLFSTSSHRRENFLNYRYFLLGGKVRRNTNFQRRKTANRDEIKGGGRRREGEWEERGRMKGRRR